MIKNARDALARWFVLQADHLTKEPYLYSLNVANHSFVWYFPQQQDHVMIFSQDQKDQAEGTIIHLGKFKIRELENPQSSVRKYLQAKIGERPTQKLMRKIRRTTKFESNRDRIASTLQWIGDILKTKKRSDDREPS